MSFFHEHPQIRIIQDIARKKKVSVYLVGGFLRDYLLNRPCQDFDFTLKKDALKIARQFARRIKGAFVVLDKERGCARVVKKKDDSILTFDFADFRAPTLKKDLLHRDFTINTLCVDLNAIDDSTQLSQVLLNFKKGWQDIKLKKIRTTSVKAFKEDPLRLLRAFSLKAMLDFKIEPQTLTRIRKDKDLIRGVSYERIRDELFKILETARAAENLKAMDKIGLLEKIIPQITVMYNVKQGGYHHLDVWPHSLETVAQLERVFMEMENNSDVLSYVNEPLAGPRRRHGLMKLAALLHDIGKPDTLKKEEGRVSFHGHERVGKSIVRSVAKLLKLSTKERVILEDMVLWHLRPGYLSNFQNPSERSIFRYFRDTKDEAVSISLLSLADQRSTRGPLTTANDQKHHEKICLRLIGRWFEMKKQKPFVRLITGHDLINKLKLIPSPLFAKILREIEEQQAVGKIATKQEALALAEEITKQK